MSFLTALGGLAGGFGQSFIAARQQRDQERLAQEQQREQERIDTANARAQGYDLRTGQVLPLPPIAKPPLAKNYGSPQLAAANRDQQRWQQAWDYLNNPDPRYQAMGAALVSALSAEGTFGLHGSETQLNLQGKLPQAQAEAAYYLGRNPTVLAVARGNQTAAWQRLQASIQSRQDIAQYDAKSRAAIAQYAAAIQIRGRTQDEAVREAIAVYDGLVRGYIQRNSPQAQLLGGDQSGGAFPSMQPITINVDGNGVPPGVNMPTFPGSGNGGPAFPPVNGNGGGGGGNGSPRVAPPAVRAPSGDATVQSYVQRARTYIQQGYTPVQIEQAVDNSRRLSPSEKQQVLRQLFGGAGMTPPQPGGSQATSPFPR